jgi:predicted flap endonuclease-1-like 5' DNA nuclease
MNANRVADVSSTHQAAVAPDSNDARDSGVIPRADGSPRNVMQHAEELENKGVESSAAALSGEHEIDVDLSPASSASGAPRAAEPKRSSAVVNTTVGSNTSGSNNTAGSKSTSAGRANGRSDARDEETFELSDDEIEPAEAVDRPSLVPGSSRHRPPPLPSTRPRSPGASNLPPPVRPATPMPPASLWASTQTAVNAKNRISALEHEVEEARWQLANRTLELSRLKARCAELESALTVRDRHIGALSRRLLEAEATGVPSSVVFDVSDMAAPEATSNPAAVSSAAPTTQPSRSAPARELPSAPTTVPSAAISSVIKAEATKSAAVEPAASVDETPLPGDAEELFTPTPSPAEVDASWRDGADELARISGINPVIAQSLRSQGISRLSQIAAWSDDDVRRIAKAIKVPKSRISRGRWVQKAREALAVASSANLAREDEAPVSTSNL